MKLKTVHKTKLLGFNQLRGNYLPPPGRINFTATANRPTRYQNQNNNNNNNRYLGAGDSLFQSALYW